MREQWQHWIAAALIGLMLIGCESSPETQTGQAGDRDSEDTDTDAGTGGTTTPRPSGPVDQPPDRPAVPDCMKTCQTKLDCVTFSSGPLEQADNFDCQNNLCIHRGCTSDANCREAYPAQNYRCSDRGECLLPCETPADCVRFDLFIGDHDQDENNYECTDGMCRYLGCLSTAECVVAYGPNYVCVDTYHSGIKTCHEKCGEDGSVEKCVPDHSDPARDDDNFECVLQFCFYTGCNSDDECGDGYRCLKVM